MNPKRSIFWLAFLGLFVAAFFVWAATAQPSGSGLGLPEAAPPGVILAPEIPAAAPIATWSGLDQFFIKLLTSQNPAVRWLAIFCGVIGSFRVWLKPLMSLLWGVVKATPTVKDDVLVSKICASQAFGWGVYFLDYVFSFKLAHPDALAIARQIGK